MFNFSKNKIITTITPLRISIFGGGTDLPYFINKNGYGKVLNFSIDKYIYTFAKIQSEIFNKKYRFNYHQTENVNKIDKIKNNIIRNSIKYYKYNEPLYIATISDIPAGTGMGSSGAFQVSVCKILNILMRNKRKNNLQLAQDASKIEMSLTKSEAGFQDQYSAACGGFNEYTFYDNSKISVKKLNQKFQLKFLKNLSNNSILIFTNKNRKAQNILKEQKNNYKKKDIFNYTKRILQLEEDFFKKLNDKSSDIIDYYNDLMNESWNLKKSLSKKISNNHIENIFDFLKKNGMISGKILGAGGGGFVLCTFKNPLNKKKFIKNNNKKFKMLNFNYSHSGIITTHD